MSQYPTEELIALWTREALTTEQMIGQLIQVAVAQEQRLRALERRVPQEPVVPPAAPPPKVGPKRR